MKHTLQKGTGLVEVVVASAIVTLVVFSLIGAYTLYFREGVNNLGRIQGSLLAEEGVEALKFMRDGSWNSNIANLSTTTDYYLATSSGLWQATTSAKYVWGRFARTFRLSNVSRDSNSDIVPSGGTLDTGTRKVVVTVSWQIQNGTTSVSIPTYITNLFSN